ncbi:MAG: hypothetical protein KI790_08905 [Cyclobacteriaceae bacterium]|nr:hypothetical protein [Cyclobacteriaceae bacterium HetDA_MAG_MS6]
MMRLLLILSIVCWASLGHAQDTEPSDGEIVDAEVIVEKEKQINLPKSTRLYQRSTIQNRTIGKLPLRYQLSEPTFEVPVFQADLTAKDLEEPVEETIYKTFLKAGYGNFQSPLFQVYHHNFAEDKYRYTIHARHESFGKGPVRDDLSSSALTQMDFEGEMIGKKSIAAWDLGWKGRSYHHYGISDTHFDQALASENFLTDKIVFNSFNAGILIADNGQADSRLKYKVAPYWVFSSNKESGGDVFAEENNVGMDVDVDWSISSTQNLGAELQINTSSYISDVKQNRTWITFNPWFKISQEKWHLIAGIQLGNYSDSSSHSEPYITPDMHFQYHLTTRWKVFSEVTGGVTRNTMTDLAEENFFLDDSLDLQTTFTPFKASVGVSALFADHLSFRAFASIANTKRLQVFVPGQADSSRFVSNYDNETTIFSVGGEVLYHLTDQLTASLTAEILSYHVDVLREPWHLPSSKFDLTVSKGFGEDLTVSAALHFLGGIKSPNAQGETEQLGAIADLSVHSQYQFSKKFGAFLGFQNLFNSDYERYYNYNVRGISLKGGLTYRF